MTLKKLGKQQIALMDATNALVRRVSERGLPFTGPVAAQSTRQDVDRDNCERGNDGTPQMQKKGNTGSETCNILNGTRGKALVTNLVGVIYIGVPRD
jgi:hypothetical protein